MRVRELIDQPQPGALDNVNTPMDYGSATHKLMRSASAGAIPEGSPAAAQQINVQYYALLREQAGRSSETLVTTAAHSARAL